MAEGCRANQNPGRASLPQHGVFAEDPLAECKTTEDFEKFFSAQSFKLSTAVVVFVVLAFLLGKFDASWVALLVLCFLAVWKWQQKLLTIRDFAFREAEILEHRKKAFESAETVEWLNFFLNRW